MIKENIERRIIIIIIIKKIKKKKERNLGPHWHEIK